VVSVVSVVEVVEVVFGRFPTGRALRFNLFARASQKGFPLQSLTQNIVV